MANINKITLENVKILWPNFEGRGDQFNPIGTRHFTIALTPEAAQELIADGWNVKSREPRIEDDAEPGPPLLTLKVAVKFGSKPPLVILNTSTARTRMTEEIIGVLDGMDFSVVDVVLEPYDWDRPGFGSGSGTKAYLKTAFLTLDEDDLMLKYGYTGAEGGGEDLGPV